MLTLANSLTADMGLIPGLAFVGPAMGLPLSVLAAFVERPFYSLAGVKRHAIWYSLQANLVSLGVGFIATLAATAAADFGKRAEHVFILWPFLAVCLSIVIERSYLQVRLRPDVVKWGWTALGNIVSAALCVGVLFLVVYLRPAVPELRRALSPFVVPLEIIAFAGSTVLFLISFALPRRTTAEGAIAVESPIPPAEQATV